MNDTIDKTIELLAKLSTANTASPDAALKFTQAALNLAHVRATYNNIAKS
jgi:hypothetical protein